ncbi:DUF1127 domain-containing protein [Benzoatithermus flavus]|jgi:uncharacterized protein YjiS (DUF1127 family)|uniref:DUF1127 domain-containing protein n=1 Tax=Benzoatithermus flavus TaxID=3108223 RepID=A0ABU8XVW5_9PROT
MPDPTSGARPRTVLGGLLLRAREQLRYWRALHVLRRLDDRDLDDIGIARVDFPALARRHARGATPLVRPFRDRRGTLPPNAG